MSRKPNPYDNAAMESFNATYKRECVALAEERGGYATRAEATHAFFDYVEKYPDYIRAVTVDDISRVARTYLDSENYSLVVVGPVDATD